MNNPALRNKELAKIHIAKKDLHMDDDSYREIIRIVGKAKSGSSADLDLAGRSRVLHHFKQKGWKPRKKKSTKNLSMASQGQIDLIHHIWQCLGARGVVKDTSKKSLRIWLMNTTQRYHDKKVGFSSPEFLPKWVAVKVIEQLKNWANRSEVNWQ